MEKNNLFKWEKPVFIFISAALWIYLCLRAFWVTVLNDEAVTFFQFILPNDFIPPHAHWDANNHILNSALAYLSYCLFGSSAFALRLPNLLFAGVYFYFCFKIASLIKQAVIRWSFILTFIFAQFMLDFFAYCRGYGMSQALLLAAIWFTIRFLKDNKTWQLVVTLILLLLSVSANLNLVVSSLIFVGIISLNIAFGKTKVKNKILHFFLLFILGVLPVIFFIKLLFILKAQSLLYLGGNTGFIDITLTSLTSDMLGFSNIYSVITIVSLFWLIIILTFISVFFKNSIIEFIKSPRIVFFILLSGNIMALYFLNWLFKTNFPVSRTALFYFHLYFGALYFTLDFVYKKKNSKILLVFCFPLIFFLVHFFRNMNIDYSYYWQDDQFPERFYQKAAFLPDTSFKKFPPVISANRINQLCWYFYNFNNGGNCNIIQSDDFPCRDADFLLAKKSDCPNIFEQYDSLDYYNRSGLYLLKRKQFKKRILVDSVINFDSKGISNDEFFNIWKGNANDFTNKSIEVGICCSLFSKTDFFKAHLIVSVQDENNNNLRYECTELGWLKKRWDGQYRNFRSSIFISNLPQNSREIKVYLWNINKTKFAVANGSCNINFLSK